MRITGTDPTNNITIQNTLGSPVASFYNDYRFVLIGDASVLVILLALVSFMLQDPLLATKIC